MITDPTQAKEHLSAALSKLNDAQRLIFEAAQTMLAINPMAEHLTQVGELQAMVSRLKPMITELQKIRWTHEAR